MATDERKQRIQEHLKATSGDSNESLYSIVKIRQAPPAPPQVSTFSTQPTKPKETVAPPPQTEPAIEPVATEAVVAPPQPVAPVAPKIIAEVQNFKPLDTRKRNIMDHVQKTSVNFGDFSLNSKDRQKQILEHLRKSQG